MLELRAEGVCVNIGKRRIISDVTFTATPGSLTAIVGTNGVGKSTLLRGLAAISKLDSGRVLVDGRDLRTIRPRQRARCISFVGQNEMPPSELTVAEYVSLSRLPYRRSWDLGSKTEHESVSRALKSLEIRDLADASCDELSGGQLRRVLLARGLAQEADIMLLDEPTNHLDVHHQLHLLKVLKATGRTLIVNIHDLDLAMNFFDQVILLHKGTVLAVGRPDEVLTEPIVSEAFHVESTVITVPGSTKRHLVIDSLEPSSSSTARP